MRPSQIRLIAAAGVLAAAIGVTSAVVVGRVSEYGQEQRQ